MKKEMIIIASVFSIASAIALKVESMYYQNEIEHYQNEIERLKTIMYFQNKITRLEAERDILLSELHFFQSKPPLKSTAIPPIDPIKARELDEEIEQMIKNPPPGITTNNNSKKEVPNKKQ